LGACHTLGVYCKVGHVGGRVTLFVYCKVGRIGEACLTFRVYCEEGSTDSSCSVRPCSLSSSKISSKSKKS